MFDPEHKDIDCPKCLRQRVYFDREIGYYCMSCGHVLTIEETLLQRDKRAAISRSATGSDKKERRPIVEIKDLRSRKIAAKHVEQNAEPQNDNKPK